MGLIMHKGEAFGSNGGNSDIIPTNWETYRAMQLAGELDPDAYYFVDDVDVSSLLPTLINEPANNNVLVYDGTSGIWKNKMLTADDISYDENTSVEDKLTSLNSALGTLDAKIDAKRPESYYKGIGNNGSTVTITIPGECSIEITSCNNASVYNFYRLCRTGNAPLAIVQKVENAPANVALTFTLSGNTLTIKNTGNYGTILNILVT